MHNRDGTCNRGEVTAALRHVSRKWTLMSSDPRFSTFTEAMWRHCRRRVWENYKYWVPIAERDEMWDEYLGFLGQA